MNTDGSNMTLKPTRGTEMDLQNQVAAFLPFEGDPPCPASHSRFIPNVDANKVIPGLGLQGSAVDMKSKNSYDVDHKTTSDGSHRAFSSPSNSTKSKKKGKNTRTKAKSNRPLTAFNLYFRDQRERVAKMRRQLPPGEACPSVAKLISIQWKALSHDIRACYDTMAAEEKLRRYNDKQGWIKYSESPPQSTGDDIPYEGTTATTASHHASTGQQLVSTYEVRDDDTPWPIESVEQIASQWDEASIDFIIRVLA